MERQAILFREDPSPPRVWAVLTEHVLTMDIGNPTVMLAQVEHIDDMHRVGLS
jgi:hypothetical protein